MTDVPVDNTSASAVPPPRASAYNGLTEAEEEELKSELAKVKRFPPVFYIVLSGLQPGAFPVLPGDERD